MNRKLKMEKLIIHGSLMIACLFVIFPIYSIINVALKTHEEFLKYPTKFIMDPIFSNFITAWKTSSMASSFKNSIIISTITPLLTALIAAMAAFPISRRHFKSSDLLYTLFVISMFVPTSFITQIYLMKSLHLIGHIYGLIILYVSAIGLPVIIISGYIKSLPREMDEAAAIEGCSYLGYIFRMIIPLSKPAIVTVVILNIIGSWNNFISPFLYLTEQSKRPVSTGLYMFVGTYATDYTVMCAGVIIVATPVILAYVFLQRYIISGMVVGAVKG